MRYNRQAGDVCSCRQVDGHIFPLAYERQWNDCNLSRLITVPPANESHGSINSVQNGIMLTCEMHQFFASYDLAINPDVCRAKYSRLRG